VSQLVRSIYLDSEVGVSTELVPDGPPLENPYVYDSAARELKAMAEKGLVRIVHEQVCGAAEEPLIGRISFARLK